MNSHTDDYVEPFDYSPDEIPYDIDDEVIMIQPSDFTLEVMSSLHLEIVSELRKIYKHVPLIKYFSSYVSNRNNFRTRVRYNIVMIGICLQDTFADGRKMMYCDIQVYNDGVISFSRGRGVSITEREKSFRTAEISDPGLDIVKWSIDLIRPLINQIINSLCERHPEQLIILREAAKNRRPSCSAPTAKPTSAPT